MAQEETFKKEVITKSDGRYLIYYDFPAEEDLGCNRRRAPAKRPVTEQTEKEEERK